MRKIIIPCIAALTGLYLAACTAKEEHQEHSEHEDHAHEDHSERRAHGDHEEQGEEKVVRLPESGWEEFGIDVTPATAGTLKIHVTLPGEIAVNQDRLAHIVPRFSGVAIEVRKAVGDHVKEGEVLAVIESNESLAPYEIKSLIEGTVIDKHITLGEALSDEDEAFVIADLSTVWVNLSVYQKDLLSIRKGQRVMISAGHGIPDVQGTISYVGPVVDEHTRTGLARVVLPNSEGYWHPGLFVTTRIAIDQIEAQVVVPRTALQTVDGETCVFVLTDEGFEPQPITVGRKNKSHVEVTAGLKSGQRYVTKGAFTLKAELSKGAFGDGHAH